MDTLSWSSGSGFFISTLASADAGVTSYLQRILVQTGLVNIQGQVTAVGTMTAEAKGTVTAEVKGTLTAAINNVVTAEARGFITAYLSGTARVRPLVTDYLATGLPAISGITGVSVFPAQGAGTGICITEVTVTNSNVSTGTVVSLQNGTQALHPVYCAAAGGGAVLNFADNPFLVSANSAFIVSCDNSGQVYVGAVGYRQAL